MNLQPDHTTSSPRPWPDGDDAALRRGKRSGDGPAQIGKKLGRSEESVRRRAIALGIPWRDE